MPQQKDSSEKTKLQKKVFYINNGLLLTNTLLLILKWLQPTAVPLECLFNTAAIHLVYSSVDEPTIRCAKLEGHSAEGLKMSKDADQNTAQRTENIMMIKTLFKCVYEDIIYRSSLFQSHLDVFSMLQQPFTLRDGFSCDEFNVCVIFYLWIFYIYSVWSKNTSL